MFQLYNMVLGQLGISVSSSFLGFLLCVGFYWLPLFPSSTSTTGTYMNVLMGGSEATFGRLLLTGSASLTQTVLSSYCAHVLVDLVLILLLLTHASFLILTGTHKMTFRWRITIFETSYLTWKFSIRSGSLKPLPQKGIELFTYLGVMSQQAFSNTGVP